MSNKNSALIGLNDKGTRGNASFEGSSAIRGDLTGSSTLRGDLNSTLRGESTLRGGGATINEKSSRQNLTHFSSVGELRHHFYNKHDLMIDLQCFVLDQCDLSSVF